MSTFTRIATKRIIKSNCSTVQVCVVKYRKDGTSRTFFRPEFQDNPVSTVMHARMYDAEKQAKEFIAFKLAKLQETK